MVCTHNASCHKIFTVDNFHDSDAFLMNWLANLTGKLNGFKEMDLLQEHQNFWVKVDAHFQLQAHISDHDIR